MSSLFAIPAIRNTARAARLLFVPFPLAISVCFALLRISDYILYPERDRTAASMEPGEYIGAAVIIIFTVIFQLIFGAPLLLILDSLRARARWILFTGIVFAVGLSSLFAWGLRASEFGETFLFLFPWVFGLLGLPIIACYALAAYPPLRFWQDDPTGAQKTH